MYDKARREIISASILAADFADLRHSVDRVARAGVDYLHCDIMDHHFVPNLSFGPVICAALRQCTAMPIDVHLMVNHPESLIQPFADAGANLLIFHPETVADVMQALAKVRAVGMQVGLALNPEIPLNLSSEVLRAIDLLLMMSVNPGFGGQSFIPESLQKIKQARTMLDAAESQALLGVDGGVKADIVGSIVQAGADFIVIGSGLFHAVNYEVKVREIRQHMEQGHALDDR